MRVDTTNSRVTASGGDVYVLVKNESEAQRVHDGLDAISKRMGVDLHFGFNCNYCGVEIGAVHLHCEQCRDEQPPVQEEYSFTFEVLLENLNERATEALMKIPRDELRQYLGVADGPERENEENALLDAEDDGGCIGPGAARMWHLIDQICNQLTSEFSGSEQEFEHDDTPSE